MSDKKDPSTTLPPKDRINVFLNAARTSCIDMRDYYKGRVAEIKTGQLSDIDTVREFESVLEDMNRFQFGIEQIEILMKYLK